MLLSVTASILNPQPPVIIANIVEVPKVEVFTALEPQYFIELATTTQVLIPEDYFKQQAISNAVSVDLILYIVEHESRFCKDQLGDMEIYKNGKPVRARGCWQITEYYHPEISDKCAFDIVCSTAWAIPRLKDKETCLKEWTTCRDYYKVASSISVLH
jgi:hypothetical protein